MRTFISIDKFYVTNRGWCYTGMVQPDPPLELGEIVRLDGEVVVVRGVERHMSLHGGDPGQPIGILV